MAVKSKFKFKVGRWLTDEQGRPAMVLARYRIPEEAAELAYGVGTKMYVLGYREDFNGSFIYGDGKAISTFVWTEESLKPNT